MPTIINQTNIDMALTLDGLRDLLELTPPEKDMIKTGIGNHYWVKDPLAESILEYKYDLPIVLDQNISLGQIDLAASLHNGARLEAPLETERVIRMASSFVAYKHGMRPLVLWFSEKPKKGKPTGGVVLEGNHCLATARLLEVSVYWAYCVYGGTHERAMRIARSWNTIQGMGQRLSDSYLHAVHDLNSTIVSPPVISQVARLYDLNTDTLERRYYNDQLRRRAVRPTGEGGFGLTGDMTRMTEGIMTAVRALPVSRQRRVLERVLDGSFDSSTVTEIVHANHTGGEEAFEEAMNLAIGQATAYIADDPVGTEIPHVDTVYSISDLRRALNTIRTFARYTTRVTPQQLRGLLQHHGNTWHASSADLTRIRNYINEVLA